MLLIVHMFQVCEVLTYLLERFHKVMLPLALYGDGNCQFRAVSLERYGTQEHRAKESMEIAMHQEWYDE